jgi:hypothetical protein
MRTLKFDGTDEDYLIVLSALDVMKDSVFLGCHEHEVTSPTWPDVCFISRIYGSPLMNVALSGIIELQASFKERVRLLLFAVSIIELCLQRTRDYKEALSVVGVLHVMYLDKCSSQSVSQRRTTYR